MTMRAVRAEIAKLRRSTVPWWTLAVVAVSPLLSNVFVSAQDSAYRTIDWPTFFDLGGMTMGTWYGILLFGLVTSYVFGREYVEGVSVNMLTVPIRREWFILAKFVVLAVWVCVLALTALLAQALWASVLGFDGFNWADLRASASDLLTVALLIFLTQSVVALAAVVGRGVFAPMIVSAFGFTAGMLGGISGWGEWLPWAMPTVVSGTFLGPDRKSTR